MYWHCWLWMFRLEEIELLYTMKPVLKDHPIGHKNMVSQGRWSLVTGSFTLK